MNQTNSDDDGIILSSPNISSMNRIPVPRDIRIANNNTISNNAQRRLRRQYGIDFRGLTRAQQRQAINNVARGIRGGTRNFRNTTYAYRFLARNYNEALIPIRENIITQNRNRLAAIQLANQETILNFTLRYTGWNGKNQVIRNSLRNYTATLKRKDQTNYIVKKKAELKKQLDESPTAKSRVELVKKDNIEITDPNPLGWTPIMMAGIMDLDNNVENASWCKDRGMCCVDLILHRYSQKKGFIKGCKTDELIEKWSCGRKGTDGVVYEADPEILNRGLMNPNKQGYTLHHLKVFCENFSVNMYCLIDGKLVDYYYTKKARIKKTPPLVFELKNNHMYPILDTRKIKAITNNRKQADLEKLVKSNNQQKVEAKDEQESEVDIAFLDTNIFHSKENMTYLEYACEKMVECNTMIYPKKNLQMFNRGMSSFKLEGTKHLLYQDVRTDKEMEGKTKTAIMKNNQLKTIKEYLEKKNIQFTGQSAPMFIQPYMKKFNEMHSSYLSADVDELLQKDNIKNRTHNGTIKFPNYSDLQELYQHTSCYDINKNYRYVMENPTEDFMIIDFWNTLSRDIPKGDIKPLGLYAVETSDNDLFHYSNVYSSAKVNKAIKEKIDFKIIAWAKGDGIGKTALKTIIDEIKNDYEDVGLQKLIINCMYGYLMKTHNSKTMMNVDEDVNRVWDTYIKVRGKNNQSLLMEKIETSSGKILYCYGNQKKTKIVNNNLPMAIQITDQADIMLYDLIKKMKGDKGTLLYRNTDCAVVGFENPADIIRLETNNIPGGISEYDKPKLENVYTEKEECERMVYWKPKKNEWNDIKENDSNQALTIICKMIANGGGMLMGRAGTGKSYCIKKAIKYLETKGITSKCLAFTNKATIQLNGTTIHKFMTIDKDGKLNQKWARDQARNIDVIFVDEISMISSELWKVLAEFKYYTGITFILIGDFRQLPPVNDAQLSFYEKEDWFNHPTIKLLAKNMRCELTITHRYDPALAKILDDIWETNGKNSQKFLSTKTKRTITELANSKNITYCNSTRKDINKVVEKYLTKDLDKDDCIFIPYKGEKNKYNQDVVLFKGAKLIMYMTTKCKTFKKNEEVEVVDFNDKTITIKANDKTETFKYIGNKSKNTFHKMFLLGYATTIHKSQGDTIKGMLNIFDTDMIQNWLEDRRALYTALSRATNLKCIRISE